MSGVRKCDVRCVVEDSARDGKSVFGSLSPLGKEPSNRGANRGQRLHVAAQFSDSNKEKIAKIQRLNF